MIGDRTQYQKYQISKQRDNIMSGDLKLVASLGTVAAVTGLTTTVLLAIPCAIITAAKGASLAESEDCPFNY